MEFDILDNRMRSFEKSLDRNIPQDIYLLARLDGHGFTRLTKKEWSLERPFDIKFRDIMVETLKHIMGTDFRIIFGYTQSDEISLLFHPKDELFNRRERKLLTILSGEASAFFSLQAERLGVFDCRLIPLPSLDDVIDYFRWRQEDSHRNSLNGHCYWALRNNGQSAAEATKMIKTMSNPEKRDLLLKYGIDYAFLPSWQRHGVCAYFQMQNRMGYNPKTKTEIPCQRKVLNVDYEMPVGENYSSLLTRIITTSL